ncbi:putative transcriptional regulator [Pseudomonas aeruginosa]|nr:putative transcriptional regulator [Pseudomonas aeruginosa]
MLVRQGHPLAGCGSIHELLEQDWALNYTGDGHDALMRELFWRHGALIDERRIVRAHSVAILQTLVEQADMCTWVPAIIGAAPPLLGRGGAAGAAGNLRATTAGHHHPARGALSNPAQCFVECLLQVIRPPRPLGEEG